MFGDADRAFEASVDLFCAARRAGERDMVARAAEQLVRHAWAAARYPEALPLAEAYVHENAGGESPFHFAALLNFTHMLSTLGRADESLAVLDEAETHEYPVSLDDMVRLLHQRAFAIGQLGHEQRSCELFLRAAEMARKRMNPHLKAQVLNNFAVHKRFLGHIDEAVALHEEAFVFCRDLKIAWRAQYYSSSQGLTNYYAGNLERAAALHDRAEAEPPGNRQVSLANANLGLMLGVAMERGDLLERYGDSSYVESAFASQEPFRIASAAASRHRYLAYSGEIRQAEALLARAAPVFENPHCCNVLFLEVAAHGKGSTLERAIECNGRFSRRSHVREAFDRLLRARCMELQHEAGFAHEADRAAAAFAALNWPMHRAASFELAGRYREAATLYERCGALGDARRAAARRRRSGRPRRVSGQLTTREWEVAKLCVDGLRNREIARRLGVSVGTVEYHVRNVLRALDLTSRYELREALPDLR
ncbi:MAG: LuxR C-terminal-related transcriptional regulator [Candidatus Tyrphobacter sp.]